MDAVESPFSLSDSRGYHGQSAAKVPKTVTNAGQGAEHVHYFLQDVVKELVHQESDIRVRALRKLQNILVSDTHPNWEAQSDVMALLRNLLEWFNLPTPSAADQVLALSILTRLAQLKTPYWATGDMGIHVVAVEHDILVISSSASWQDELVRKFLVDLGAVEFMKDYEVDVSPAIVPFITSLVYTLRGRVDNTVSDTPKARYFSGKEPDLWSFSNTQQIFHDKAVAEQPLKDRAFELLVDKDSERERAKEKKYSSQVRGECIQSGDTASSSPLRNNDCLSPSHESLVYHSVSSRDGVEHPAGYIRVTPMKEIPRNDFSSNVSDSDAFKSIMPCIALEENDKKYLFNINVTLQKFDSPQVLLTAFKELREAVVFDFHSEALLQNFSVVQNTFEVLSKVKDNHVEHVVFEFLRELVRQIKGSLKISTEAAFQVHPENQTPLQAIQAKVAGVNGMSQTDLNDSYPIYLKACASDDSERVSGSHAFLSGPGSVNDGGQQSVFTLSQSLHLFVLQLLPLLTNDQHRDLSLNILYELLPLLKPCQEENLPDKVQVYFTQYFQVLCEVIQTLDGNSGDLDALCVEQTRRRSFDSRARHCLPLLSVLTFSSELLFLLQPSHVVGLLPSYLVKALTTSTEDLIFAECTFGTHKRILPYLQYLDPEYYKSYTCASKASSTLLMLRKRLADLEEALAHCKGQSISPDLDVESLLTHMIDAASFFSFLSDTYLVRRQIRVVSDALRIEIVNVWKQRNSGYVANGHRDGNTDRTLTSPSSNSVLEKARILILLLISNTSMSVRKSAYDAVLEISDRDRWLACEKKLNGHEGDLPRGEECIVDQEVIVVDDSGYLWHLRGGGVRPLCVFQRLILYSPRVLGEIITAGLHVGATCKQAAELLFYLFEDMSEVGRSELMDVHPWIECGGARSPELGTLVGQISEMLIRAQLSLETSRQSSPKNRASVHCVELSSILRSLFSSSTSQRWRASSALLKVIRNSSQSKRCAPWWLERLPVATYSSSRASQGSEAKTGEDASLASIDPFQHCFIRQEDVVITTSTSCSQDLGKRSHRKISSAGQKKIGDLLSIFKSKSVGEIIRKSAVEHLIWLIEDPSLCCLLESDEELFKALIFEIMNSITEDEVHGKGRLHPVVTKNISDDGVSPILEDFGTVCLSFLTKLASAAALDGQLKVRDLLISNSFEHLWSFLPMVYHPSETARKDMAILLSFCLFSSDMLLRGLKQMGIISEQLPSEMGYQSPGRLTQLFVPAPFARAYCFPCQVTAVQIIPSASKSSENPVDEGFVNRFISQTDLLEEGPEKLLLQLERKVSAGEPLQIIELQAFSCLSILHPEISVKRTLKLLADSQHSYGIEIQLLGELEAQCFRHPQAAEILAQNSWAQSFQRFLARFPSTEEELTQLLKAIKLIQLIIRSKSANSSGFIASTTLVKQILLPLLAKGPHVYNALVLGERYPGIDLEVIILRLIVDTLLYSMEHADQELFYQVSVRLAKDTSLLSILLSKFVKSSSSPYICCLLAVRCFTLITKGLASFVGENVLGSVRGQGSTSRKKKRSSNQEIVEARVENVQAGVHRVDIQQGSDYTGTQKEFPGAAVEQDLVQIIVPLIKHMAHLHSHHYRSLRHKGLVREIVSCLWSVTSFVLPCIWQDLWSSTGITYWLSRLLEDKEAILRGMAYGILALLGSPAAPGTRELLARNWPELGDIAVRSILNEGECYAVREQGLCFIISATVWSTNERFSITMEENCPPTSFKIIDGLGINAALQRYEFWNRLPSLLLIRNGTPGFYRVLLELILNLATSDVGFLKTKILEIPTFFKGLVQILDYVVLEPSESGRREGGNLRGCKHSADILAIISSLGEILRILAQDEDTSLQALIESDVTISKLFLGLDYCLSDQNHSSRNFQVSCGATIYSKLGPGKDREVYNGHRTFEKLDRIADYERVEAIFQLSEVLNLVTSKLMSRACPFPRKEINHVRVDDIRALNSSDSEGMMWKEGIGTSYSGISSESSWCHYVHMVGNHSGVFCGIARLLRGLPVITDLQDLREQTERQFHVDLNPSALLRRVQLAVCTLVGTFLSEEKQAGAVLDGGGLKLSEVESRRVPYDNLAEQLYDVLLQLLEDAHEQIQQPKVPQEDFIMYLESLIMTVGRALQNLITFSCKAKDDGTGSGLPTILMRLAYEVYTFLDSCGLVPKRLDTPLTPISRGGSSQRSKHGNKVPKLLTQSRRSSRIRSSSICVSPRHGKLNEHHRDLLLVELVLCVRLLKNYVYRSEKAAEACVEEGVFEFIWTLWAFALREENLMHEVLGLLSNLAALSNKAKEIMALQTCEGKKGGSLMDNVTYMIYHLPLDQISYTTSIGLLQNLVIHAQPRAVFIRKHYFADCLQLFRGYVRANDVLRQYLMLQLFINLSAFQNGHRMFLKALSDGSMLDLLLDSVEQSHYVPASSSALFLLRNLAFCRETRFFFLCNERTLRLLVKSLESSSLEARAYGSSALWILASSERRVSAALKKIGAPSGISRAYEAAKQHLQIYENFSTQGNEVNLRADAVQKIGLLVRNTEQSLFAVLQLVKENWEFETATISN